jgi:hypothetical protein
MGDFEEEERDQRGDRIDLKSLKEHSTFKVTDSFCSRIVQQTTRRCVRCIKDTRFLGILMHSYPEQTEFSPPFPAPLRSPYRCLYCRNHFDTVPVFIPMRMLEGTWEEWGNFCCGACANSYLHLFMNQVDLPGRAADLFAYMRQVHGFKGTELGILPEFHCHKDYGGPFDDTHFQKLKEDTSVKTRLLMWPFIPTDAVIEVCARAGDVLEGVLGSRIPTAITERQQHKWEVRGIRQPPLEEIEARLASLPPREKRTGAFELFCARKDEEEAAGRPGSGGAGAGPGPGTGASASAGAGAGTGTGTGTGTGALGGARVRFEDDEDEGGHPLAHGPPMTKRAAPKRKKDVPAGSIAGAGGLGGMLKTKAAGGAAAAHRP